MNKTTYDAESKVASIQSGSTWGLAYEALNEYGVTAIGGRASIVGVGGFITGGGVSRAAFLTAMSLRTSSFAKVRL
jgi:FAD/FMN-containing dehydrogenase